MVKYKCVLFDLSIKKKVLKPTKHLIVIASFISENTLHLAQRVISDFKSPLSIHNTFKWMLICRCEDSTIDSIPFFKKNVAEYLVEPDYDYP